jgi:ribose transport system substrate-binding protein
MVLLLPAAILFTVLLAISFSPGCKRSSRKQVERPRRHAIAVIPKTTSQTFWQVLHAGASKAGREFGYEILYHGPEHETNRQHQIQIIEEFIAQRVEGLVLAPLDRKELAPSVERLDALKIPCAIIDSGIATDRYLCFAAADHHQAGVMAARRMGQILDRQGKVLILRNVPNDLVANDRENGFTQTILKEFPSLQISESNNAGDTVETAHEVTQALLTRHPDAQGIFACTASASIGALDVLKNRNPTVKLIGCDLNRTLFDALNAGQIDSLAVPDSFRMGYESVKAVVSALKGEPVQKQMDTGVELLTKASLEDPAIRERFQP